MRVGIIGAGHIARALGLGWSRPGLTEAPELTFLDVMPDQAERAAEAASGQVASSLDDLVTLSDVLVVAVRPQHVAEVLAEVAALLGDRPLVSVAAGVSLAELRSALPAGARVARVMPNVAAAVGLGVFLFVPGTLGDHRQTVDGLFALAGEVVVLQEEDFDSATAIAGCMPGMLATLVRDFARAGEKRGLDADVARRLAVAGVYGSAAIIAREGDPDAVIASAATPGGMTAAGVAKLEERGLATAVALAVHAAAERAKELR
jgi:pyrroline-5-carboxylate reductase